MSTVFYNPRTGQYSDPMKDEFTSQWLADGWQVYSRSSAPAAGPSSTGGAMIAPELIQYYRALDYSFQAHKISQDDYRIGIDLLNTINTKGANDQSFLLGAANLIAGLQGPESTAAWMELNRGNTSGRPLGGFDALRGALNLPAYGEWNQSDLKARNVPGFLKDVLGGGGGSGGGGFNLGSLGMGADTGPSVAVNGQEIGGDVARGATAGSVPMLAGANDLNMLQVGTANGTGPGVRNELGLGGGVGGNYTTAVPRVASGSKQVSRNGYASRDDRVGYYEDIGNPNRALISYGLDPLDESGNLIRPMWIDGRLVAPDGWDHEAWRYPARNPINQDEEYAWGQYVQSGFDPALYPSWALQEEGQSAAEWQQRRTGSAAQSNTEGQQGTSAAAAPQQPTDRTQDAYYAPGAVQGESDVERQYREAYGEKASLRTAAQSGRGIKGAYAGAGWNGESTTIVIDDQDQQTEYRDSDGARVTRGATTAPSAPTSQTSGGGRTGGVGSTDLAQQTERLRQQAEQDRINRERIAAAQAAAEPPITRRAAPGAPPSGQQADSGNTSPGSGGRIAGNTPESRASGDAGGRDVDDNPERDERERAMGGLDVVTEPTRFSHGGQKFLVGEGGKDELVARTPDSVATYPLERDGVPVPPDAARAANALVPGSPYAPKGGMTPAWMRKATVPDDGRMGGDGMGMQFVGYDATDGKPLFTPPPDAPMVDVASGGEIPMAEGGLVDVAGKKGKQPKGGTPVAPAPPAPVVPASAYALSPGATVRAVNRPTNLSSLDLDTQKFYGVKKPSLPKGDKRPIPGAEPVKPIYVDENGQVAVPTGKPGAYKSIPAFSNTGLESENHWAASELRMLADNPARMKAFQSLLRAKGLIPEDALAGAQYALGTAAVPKWVRSRAF